MQRRHLLAALLGTMALSQQPLAIAQTRSPSTDSAQFWEYDSAVGDFSAAYWINTTAKAANGFDKISVEHFSNTVSYFRNDAQLSTEEAMQDVRFKAALLMGRGAKSNQMQLFNTGMALLVSSSHCGWIQDIVVYEGREANIKVHHVQQSQHRRRLCSSTSSAPAAIWSVDP